MQEIKQTFDENGFGQKGLSHPNKKFTVYITDRSGMILGLACFVFSFILAMVLVFKYRYPQYFLPFPFLVVALFFVLPMVYKKLYSREQLIELSDSKMTVSGYENYAIEFKDIKSYQIISDKGIGLSIKLKNSEKIEFSASPAYTPTKQLEQFLDAFDAKMQQLISKGMLPIERKKSFIASIWYLLLMCAYIFFMIFATLKTYLKWGHVPPMFITYFGIGIGGISSHFVAKSRYNKKFDSESK